MHRTGRSVLELAQHQQAVAKPLHKLELGEHAHHHAGHFLVVFNQVDQVARRCASGVELGMALNAMVPGERVQAALLVKGFLNQRLPAAGLRCWAGSRSSAPPNGAQPAGMAGDLLAIHPAGHHKVGHHSRRMGVWLRSSRASWPLSASSTAYPRSSRSPPLLRTRASSSTSSASPSDGVSAYRVGHPAKPARGAMPGLHAGLRLGGLGGLAASSSRSVTSVPAPGSLRMSTVPPDWRAKPYTIERPSPEPLAHPLGGEEGLEHTHWRVRASMPQPSSCTVTTQANWPGPG